MKKYDDILNLPHHVSQRHPQMPVENRAAQFAPFAAITGHDAAIRETARFTDTRIVLDEDALDALDLKIHILAELLSESPEVVVTYFQPDAKKDGGAYVTSAGIAKKFDDVERVLVFTSGEVIAIDEILDIKCELFSDFI